MNNTIMGLQTSPVRESVEMMHWNGQCTRIAHREYFATVSMSSGFASYALPIVPSNAGMFPWLYAVAQNFQKWKLLGCVFEYVPTSTNAISAGTPAVGQIAMCVTYDYFQTPPTTLTNLLNTQGAVSARPQDTLVCAVECDPNLLPADPLFIDHAGSPAGDANLYVHGNLSIATEGPAAYANCGQLWVTYDMELISAFLPSSLPPGGVPKASLKFACGDDDTDYAPAYESKQPGAVACGKVRRPPL